MESSYRRKLIRIVTFLGGIYFFLEFVLPEKIGSFEFGKYHDQLSDGAITIGVMAVGLGIINLLMVHGSKIIYRRKGAFTGFALLLSLFVMMYLTSFEWIATDRITKESSRFRDLGSFATVIRDDFESKKSGVGDIGYRTGTLVEAANYEIKLKREQLHGSYSTELFTEKDRKLSLAYRSQLIGKLEEAEISLINIRQSVATGQIEKEPDLLKTFSGPAGEVSVLSRQLGMLEFRYSRKKQVYEFVYKGLFIPLGSAMFSLLGFYIVSAGYRAFRIRSAESALMMVAAVLVMLGQIPFGLWIWDGLPDVRLWLLKVPSAGAFRAIKFGASIALLIMAFRMWLSIESQSFSEKGGVDDAS